MPVSPTYPGVYIEEVPSQVKTITGVATSVTAFVGRALKGRVDYPVYISSFGDFVRQFGGVWRDSRMSYAVSHYFSAGGKEALIVRVHDGGVSARYDMPANGATETISFEAANPGEWGDRLELFVDHDVDPDLGGFNLTVNELDTDGNVVSNEVFRNLSLDTTSSKYVVTVLEQQSSLVRVSGSLPSGIPDENTLDADGEPIAPSVAVNGNDGSEIDEDQISDATTLQASRRGLWALDNADIFNILCIPPFSETVDVDASTWQAASDYCKEKRAFLIVDSPSSWTSPANVLDATIGVDGTAADVPSRDTNSAIYFPRVKLPDREQDNKIAEFAPCGLIAGIYARTDADRGVWKAPAGQEALLPGVRSLTYKLTDLENGQLNQVGVNCLRTFPVTGAVVWGSRTLRGADRLASQYKYVPVRRLTLFIEETLYRGTQWVIFEPNDEPLWSQIRLNVGAFMHSLFRQGAFQGSSPRDAYLVKCDRETTTQNDIDRGIVNLEVGFAPLKPAEFLIIKISQLAGQIQA